MNVCNSTEEMLAAYRRSGNAELRDAAIERHERLVHGLARKFARPDVPVEDLIQTGWVALIRALERFDPGRGVRFSTYATTCVIGEIKRFFRDHTWSMKVPRPVQELATQLPRVQERLYRSLEREPTDAEMAEACGVSEERIRRALGAMRIHQLASLSDSLESVDGERPPLGERVGENDAALEALVAHAPLRQAMENLEGDEQQVLRRRFWHGWSQREVAQELHVSQMQVSRTEKRAIRRLREALTVG